jgi:hypothetical protein
VLTFGENVILRCSGAKGKDETLGGRREKARGRMPGQKKQTEVRLRLDGEEGIILEA